MVFMKYVFGFQIDYSNFRIGNHKLRGRIKKDFGVFWAWDWIDFYIFVKIIEQY